MAKNLFAILKWLVIFSLLVGAALSVFVVVKLNQPSTTFSAARDFEVKKAETAGEIVGRLVADKLVRNGLVLEIYLRLKGAEDKLQAGAYILDSNMTIPEIVQILSQGRVKASGLRLTVIEGWSITDIAGRLENLSIMQRQEFIEAAGLPRVPNSRLPDYGAEFEFLKSKSVGASLEGFLFPDTYLVKDGSGGEAVVRKMLENFGQKVTSEMRAEAAAQHRSFYDVLILASIVELEVGRNFKAGTKLTAEQIATLQQERELVAGVFMNRLRAGMALESDATVNYVTGKNSPRPELADLKIQSPYNTYQTRGLPPTPIGNPSLDSIKAALEPAQTDYLFFLTEPDGTAHFARTLEEHKQNRAKYLH